MLFEPAEIDAVFRMGDLMQIGTISASQARQALSSIVGSLFHDVGAVVTSCLTSTILFSNRSNWSTSLSYHKVNTQAQYDMAQKMQFDSDRVDLKTFRAKADELFG